jgi:hypothetical protein
MTDPMEAPYRSKIYLSSYKKHAILVGRRGLTLCCVTGSRWQVIQRAHFGALLPKIVVTARRQSIPEHVILSLIDPIRQTARLLSSAILRIRSAGWIHTSAGHCARRRLDRLPGRRLFLESSSTSQRTHFELVTMHCHGLVHRSAQTT